MTPSVSQIRDELADREAIRDCLYRYARGIDRLDEELLRSAYWPDAIDDHMAFTGTRDEFIAWVIPGMRGGMDQTQHIIANILIRLEGDTAAVESYYYGFHRVRGKRGVRDKIGAGRYLDRFERRGDEWKIARRVVVTDWYREYPDSADLERGAFGMKVAPGRRHPDDQSYAFLGW